MTMPSDPSTAETTPHRDARGRFKPGNPGGPGNPRIRRQSEYHQAVREAVRPEHLRLLLQKMLQKAIKDGDVHAARVVAERCLGRINLDPVGDGLPIELPKIENFNDLMRVTDLFLQAAVKGQAPAETIEKLARVVEGVRKVYETEVLEERLRTLEEEIQAMRASQ